VSPVTADEGTPVPQPADPARTGHAFLGWFDAATGGTAYTWPHTLNADVTMHAQWHDNSKARHTLAFESQGGSAVSPVTADEGTPIPQPADPARTGHTFLGWFDAATGGTAYAWPHILNADLTMYAQWHDDGKARHTLAFESQGGSGVSPVTADEGTAIPQPADPARTGYTFQGWFDAATGGAAYAWPHTLNADATAHAQWTAITYTVTYNANNGAGTMEASSHTYDTPKNLSPNAFARTGYTFGGWNTAANGTGTAYADRASVSNLSAAQDAAVPLYAQWWPDLSVAVSVWVNEAGTILASTDDVTISKTSNGHADRVTATLAEGYADARWQLDGAALPGNQDGSVTMDAADYANGTYILGVIVYKDGVPYSTDLRVTVIN
jgi:uncharacterized repeat protein (TIGR02543 family)